MPHRLPTHRLVASLALLLLFPACGDGGEGGGAEAPGPVVRDSAGVTIVENPAPPPGAHPGWTVGAEPLLRVGSVAGPATHQLHRVQDVHRLADGRIAVADAGSSEVRFFDGEGTHLATWGGPGDGPGEFRFPGSLVPWPGGDSLGVWDGRLRRLTVFGPGGEPGRTLVLPEIGDIQAPNYTGLLADGSLVLIGLDFRFQDADGLVRPPIRAAVVDPAGALLGDLGTRPGREAVIQASQQSVQIIGVPFARNAVVEAVGNRVVFAGTERWELHLHEPGGELERIVRVDRAPRAVTDADRTAAIEHQVAAAPEQARPALRSSLADGPSPETMPAFTRVLDDPAGNLWVEEYRPRYEEGPVTWTVLDPEGRLLGRLETPEGLTVFQVGDDFLLGVATDELGVEQVQLWPLER